MESIGTLSDNIKRSFELPGRLIIEYIVTSLSFVQTVLEKSSRVSHHLFLLIGQIAGRTWESQNIKFNAIIGETIPKSKNPEKHSTNYLGSRCLGQGTIPASWKK